MCRYTGYYTLISTSTPEGNSSFINASTVFGLAAKMSIKRLYVHNWNCSLDFLLTCGERNTVKISFRVGNGIGPLTTAPVDLTAFTILSADLSTKL